jgi:hypothetical protein
MHWLELELERVGAELSVKGRTGRDEHSARHVVDAGLAAQLDAFAAHVRAKAGGGEPLGAGLARAQALYQALFHGELEVLLGRLREAAGQEPVLLRLMLRDNALKAFPWESLCAPGRDFEFLGNSAEVHPVRGVYTTEPRQLREVRGAVRVLAIAPQHEGALGRLREALRESVEAGEVEWLTPLAGPRARHVSLLDRLRHHPIPHVVHFIGHGGVQDGTPMLRLADDDEGKESWIPVELLAQELQHTFGRDALRLIVLEACEGAKPGDQASAAELLARTGADAVMAHLWPVRADVARRCSSTFYRSLTGAAQQQGDVACSLNEARRTVLAELGGSAEAFSPVLYLRGVDPVLFDFKDRKTARPSEAATDATGVTLVVPPALGHLLEQPFSLLLGDVWEEQHPELRALFERLRQRLVRKLGADLPVMPLSMLAQHFALRIGEDALGQEFQDVFGTVEYMPPLADTLSRSLSAGVHVTLLHLPVLELALARHRPELTINVIQPSWQEAGSFTVFRREGGLQRWERLHDEVPPAFEVERELVVLRLCAGYLPPKLFSRPVLTEDDYLLGARGLEHVLPPELTDPVLGVLKRRPALLMGLSMLSWSHRMLLHHLFGGAPLPRDSLAIVDPRSLEHDIWESGKGLPGSQGVMVFETRDEELERLMLLQAEVAS